MWYFNKNFEEILSNIIWKNSLKLLRVFKNSIKMSNGENSSRKNLKFENKW